MSKNRPTIIGRQLACTNRIWNVFFTHVRDGDIEIPNYLTLETKVRAASGVTGVAILPVLDGQIGLIKIARVAMDAEFIEAPKGFVDPNEEAAGAALRELLEETGLVCAPDDVVDLGSVTPEPSTLATRTRIFAAFGCRPSGAALDAELGLGAVQFFSLNEVRRMTAESEIEDATTVAGIYRLLAKADTDPRVRAALSDAQR